MNLKLYRVRSHYIEYLAKQEPHLFHGKKRNQRNERKYVGIVLEVNGFRYFVPMSSYKEKHKSLQGRIDCISIKDYAVLNLNNMFPVAEGEYFYVDIKSEKDPHYRALLQAEYRAIKVMQDRIRKAARVIYQHKMSSVDTPLARRCNNFLALEEACRRYMQ